MANLGEIQDAVIMARRNATGGITLLHCTSAYPAPLRDANVRTVPHLAQAFDVPAGLSDHTPGSAAAVASIALGGCIVEKHFTLSRADGGPDAAFSLEPHEFVRPVDDCESAWAALGRVNYEPTASERGNLMFPRSLYVVQDISAGAGFTQGQPAIDPSGIRPTAQIPS